MSRANIKYRSLINGRYKKGIQKQDSFLPEQLIIRVGKACNFRCNFCNVADNEAVLSMKPKIKEILAQTFYKIKYSNFSSGVVNITISGGEPSLFQTETIFMLKFFSEYFMKRGIYTTFEMQSNASNISKYFAKQLKKYGVYDVMISNHTHDIEEYQEYIGVSYEHMGPKVHQGIMNLIEAGVSVSFNTILSNINKNSYLDHIKYLHRRYPEVLVYNIGFIQPHGMVQKNFDRLFIQYKEVSKTYNDVIAYLKGHKKKVHSHLVGLPLCYIDDWSCCMEYYHNKGIISRSADKQTLIQSINDNNKGYDKKCDSCMVKGLCSGIWYEYIGKQVIKPIKYQQYFHRKGDNISYIHQSGKDLRKVRDAGVKQIFIMQKDFSTEEKLIQEIKEIKKYEFHMISLCINDAKAIGNLQEYASINFQILDFKNSYLSFIESIHIYNQNVGVQFHIRLDIHVQRKILGLDTIINKKEYDFIQVYYTIS